MALRDILRSLPLVGEELRALEERCRGRMAVVEEFDHTKQICRVRFPEESAASYKWYPYSGLVQVGSWGVLQPLRGGQALFVPTQWTTSTHKTSQRFSSRTASTDLNVATVQITRAVALPQGSWDISVWALSNMSRTVLSGNVVLELRTDEPAWTDTVVSMVYDTATAGAAQHAITVVAPLKATWDVPAGGQTITFTVGVRGTGTAATTYGYGTTLYIDCKRYR